MEVRLTPDEEARLAAIAAVVGSDPAQLIKDAALRLLDEDRRFLEAVQIGIDQASRGELIDEEEVDVRVDRMLRTLEDAGSLD
jgi:predicted transcriptional regulator